MKVMKLWYHIKAAVKKIVYKMVYGKKLKICKRNHMEASVSYCH